MDSVEFKVTKDQLRQLDEKIDEFYEMFQKLYGACSKDLDNLYDEIGQLKERVSALEKSHGTTNNYYFGGKHE